MNNNGDLNKNCSEGTVNTSNIEIRYSLRRCLVMTSYLSG